MLFVDLVQPSPVLNHLVRLAGLIGALPLLMMPGLLERLVPWPRVFFNRLQQIAGPSVMEKEHALPETPERRGTKLVAPRQPLTWISRNSCGDSTSRM